MSIKITPDHLSRAAIVYVRQSTMSQVMGNLESQRRQYDLAQAAETAGFKSVTVIDDDLGRSGSGSTQRPGYGVFRRRRCRLLHRGITAGAQWA
ncbi:recombinase family protein [Bradyrhizobium sp. UFLA01-814]|uniref:recombinase family protein n=1 Tax=Bradyrhizobium sp. UFLA01-814 TaxID=3023480 RepID=UPI00398AD372